ncbi:MAG: alpha-L-arabinofuranosidase [Bacteroidota bacterium]|nr:alpha-L-arabinofuranosidase [Bacteroidota bacterium]
MEKLKFKKPFSVIALFALSMMVSYSCSCTGDSGTNPPDTNNDTVKTPVDPPVASTMGFFLDNWQSKTYVAPQYTESAIATSPSTTVTVDFANVITKIPLAIFGHNANNWMTQMYNEPVFLNHLNHLNPHVIRFPAGSGSDCFFWNCNLNQPPADAPTRLRKADGTYQTDNLYTYGKTTNSWQATVDNYYSVLQQTNSEGLITINYGYARYGTGPNPVASAAHMAADWVRYDKGRTKYWEIGNENYGDWEWGYRIDVAANKDGQPEYLTGKLYAQHFKVFADSMKKAAAETGKTIYIGAVMHESAIQGWETPTLQTWNSTMIPELNNVPDFYIGHNYFTPYGKNSDATTVLDSALTVPTTMMNYMKGAIQKYGAILKPIILSEWNMFAQDSKQQVSNTSGTFAVIVQGEALKNKFGLAARWDLYNGWGNGNDHGIFSAGDEPGVSKWSPRPSFYYLYFFQKCIGDRLVNSTVNGSVNVKAYASTYTTGQASVALVNISSAAKTVQVNFKNFKAGNRFYWYTLEGSNDNGDFSRKVTVNGSGTTAVAGGPSDYATIKARSALTSKGIRVTIPAWSAVFVMVDKP